MIPVTQYAAIAIIMFFLTGATLVTLVLQSNKPPIKSEADHLLEVIVDRAKAVELITKCTGMGKVSTKVEIMIDGIPYVIEIKKDIETAHRLPI